MGKLTNNKTLLREGNVIMFPGPKHRLQPGYGFTAQGEMEREYLSIANFLDWTAEESGSPAWTKAIAKELRSIARQINSG